MNKTIMIFGIDGYIGWQLAVFLGSKYPDYEIIGADNFSRREQVEEVGSKSLTPIYSMDERIEAYKDHFLLDNIKFIEGDLTDKKFVYNLVREWKPDVLINLAQMPSAPFSMIDCEHSTWTFNNNTNTNLNSLWALKELSPDTLYIKLSTMGIWGTPNVDIGEGFFDIEYRGRKDRLPFPKQPGSFYHITKSTDTEIDRFCCKVWGLKSVDVMQGVLYGLIDWGHPKLFSRFDVDGIMGTCLNRFVAQTLINYPLTIFGKGTQKRGFLHIIEALQCIDKYIHYPIKKGTYRPVNQFTDTRFNVNELAVQVQEAAKKIGLKIKLQHVVNPRIEKYDHYYNPDHDFVDSLGIEKVKIEEELPKLMKLLMPFKDRIIKEAIKAKVKWK